MKNHIRFFGAALAGVVALLLPLNADANCPTSISFGGYQAAVTGTTNSPSLRSNFWVYNSASPSTLTGNPGIGAGNDNGNVVETGHWLVPYDVNPNVILGDWSDANSTFDGCPDVATSNTNNQRMVVSFSDVDGSGNMTYAVACVHRDVTAAVQFSFEAPIAPLPLVAAPKAAITNTVRVGNEAQITVGAPSFAAGFKTDGSCNINDAIPQYDVYQQQVGRGVSPNSTRDAGSSWVLVGTGNAGAPFTFTTACGTTNCDVFVAVTPHYQSNFGSGEAASSAPARVGQNSTKLQAGPVLAETPKAKTIKNNRVGSNQK